MKAEQKINQSADPIRFDDAAICDACGRFGAFHIGQRTLCQDCYHGSGSCCPEFGKDDLWTFDDEK
jgi:hypothetical protein